MSLILRTMQQLSFAGARFATGSALVQARPAQRRCLATAAKATADKGLGKGDLIKAVAAKTGLSQKDADGAVNAVLDIIEGTVAQGEPDRDGGGRPAAKRRRFGCGPPRRSAYPAAGPRHQGPGMPASACDRRAGGRAVRLPPPSRPPARIVCLRARGTAGGALHAYSLLLPAGRHLPSTAVCATANVRAPGKCARLSRSTVDAAPPADLLGLLVPFLPC